MGEGRCSTIPHVTTAFRTALDERFPGSMPEESFIEQTHAVLQPFGFAPDSTLALVGVCRDELTHPTVVALRRVWGPAFRLGSLAGMLYLGRTGMRAALNNAPECPDGRKRFVAFVFSHIGIDANGVIGQCVRPRHSEASPACGALIVLHRMLQAGAIADPDDPHDIELSLLRHRMERELAVSTDVDLAALTLHARAAITEDMCELAGFLSANAPCDIAVFSGVIVHGPGGEDFIAPGRARLWNSAHIDGIDLDIG